MKPIIVKPNTVRDGPGGRLVEMKIILLLGHRVAIAREEDLDEAIGELQDEVRDELCSLDIDDATPAEIARAAKERVRVGSFDYMPCKHD